MGKPSFNEAPIFIGLTVTSLICLLAPLTVLADPEPEKLLSTVQQAVEKALNGISFQQTECRCLTPGRPNPTYRYDQIIDGGQESIGIFRLSPP